MGSFSRLRYVIAANVNSLLEKAEDPEKLLKALIRDMEDASEDARLASADLVAEQTETNRDDLARTALKAKSEIEQALHAAADESKSLDARITQLEFDMAQLKTKLAEAKTKLKEITTRHAPGGKTKAGYTERELSPAERKIRRAMGRFDRLQSQVERLEARVRSYEVGGDVGNAWAADDTPADPAIEDELQKLKDRIAPSTPEVAVETKTETEADTQA